MWPTLVVSHSSVISFLTQKNVRCVGRTPWRLDLKTAACILSCRRIFLLAGQNSLYNDMQVAFLNWTKSGGLQTSDLSTRLFSLANLALSLARKSPNLEESFLRDETRPLPLMSIPLNCPSLVFLTTFGKKKTLWLWLLYSHRAWVFVSMKDAIAAILSCQSLSANESGRYLLPLRLGIFVHNWVCL